MHSLAYRTAIITHFTKFRSKTRNSMGFARLYGRSKSTSNGVDFTENCSTDKTMAASASRLSHISTNITTTKTSKTQVARTQDISRALRREQRERYRDENILSGGTKHASQPIQPMHHAMSPPIPPPVFSTPPQSSTQSSPAQNPKTPKLNI